MRKPPSFPFGLMLLLAGVGTLAVFLAYHYIGSVVEWGRSRRQLGPRVELEEGDLVVLAALASLNHAGDPATLELVGDLLDGRVPGWLVRFTRLVSLRLARRVDGTSPGAYRITPDGMALLEAARVD